MKIKCPECKGNGIVKDKTLDIAPGGFPIFDECRRCNGKGVVEE